MPWYFWAQVVLDVVLVVYAVSVTMEGHDARDRIHALEAEIERLKSLL